MLLVLPGAPVTDWFYGLEAPVVPDRDSAGNDLHKRSRRNAEDVAVGSQMSLRAKGQPGGKIFLGKFWNAVSEQQERFEYGRPGHGAALHFIKEGTGSRKVPGQDQFRFR